jgi:hypothetical protein
MTEITCFLHWNPHSLVLESIHFIAAQAVHAQEPQVPAANALARIRAAFRYGAAISAMPT